MVEWPKRSLTILASVPRASSSVAQVCRKSSKRVSSGSSALRNTRLNTTCERFCGSCGVPMVDGNTRPPSFRLRRGLAVPCSGARAMAFQRVYYGWRQVGREPPCCSRTDVLSRLRQTDAVYVALRAQAPTGAYPPPGLRCRRASSRATICRAICRARRATTGSMAASLKSSPGM
jgi:hypothetical protein